jgi:hypothetical protein
MGFPQTIDKASPADTDNPSAGAAQIRNLKLFLEDLLGIQDAVSYSAAPFAIGTAGQVTVSQQRMLLQNGSATTPSFAFAGATSTGLAYDGATTAIAVLRNGVKVGHLGIPTRPDMGGTGQDSSAWTGVPYVTAGAWSSETRVAPARGGTGTDTSALTGQPDLLAGTWSFHQKYINVKTYGAVGNGITNDTAAIQAAINACGTSGGEVYFPPGTYLISSTLTVGNGTGASPNDSTINGIRLVGASASGYPLGVCRLVWGGAAAGIMVNVAGAIEGFECHNLEFYANTLAGYCLQMSRVHTCRLTGLQFWGYQGAGLSMSNCTAVVADNLTCWNPAVASVAGVILDGSVDGSESTCFSTFTNLIIYLDYTGAQQTYGVVLRVADACRFQTMLVYGADNVSGSCGVLFDYTINSTFPSQCTFDGCDVGWEIPVATQWQNTGSPSTSARPNIIAALCEVNGGRYPTGLANVEVDLPRLISPWVSVDGGGAEITDTTFYTPRTAGLHRVDYYAAIASAGAGGTVTVTITWNDGVGWKNTQGVLTAANVGASGYVSGSVLIYAAVSTAILYGVSFQGVTGSPTYNLRVRLERVQ